MTHDRKRPGTSSAATSPRSGKARLAAEMATLKREMKREMKRAQDALDASERQIEFLTVYVALAMMLQAQSHERENDDDLSRPS
jgi:predicted membrane chloride channel (bestrophin family)